MFSDSALFAGAHAGTTASQSPGHVSGITVPHHLLAVDLIARGFRFAVGGRYERVIAVFPDHFRKATRPFATTAQGFQTAYGPVSTDAAAVAKLVSTIPRIEVSELFKVDRGIHAVLPFLARFFPKTKLTPTLKAQSATGSKCIVMS